MGKKPPLAAAGLNQSITFPTDSVFLDGSNSSDPDGRIVSYQWRMASGRPSSLAIVDPNSVHTWVKGLLPGGYWFELTVTDDDGFSAKSAVSINVVLECGNRPEVNVQLIAIGNLSELRSNMAVGAVSNKILFAGGEKFSGGPSSRVDIFDITNNSWTTTELSEARSAIGVASFNNTVYFAGGFKLFNYDLEYSSRVDIYNADSNSWATAELSSARGMVAGAAAGNKVLFAGGYGGIYQTLVDIYDVANNTWTIDVLPLRLMQASMGIAATTIGNKIFFAGAGNWPVIDYGDLSAVINIYDAASGTWSASELEKAKGFLAGVSAGNANYWAGGEYANTYSNLVEFGDVSSQNVSYGCLFQPNAYFSAVRKDNKIIFFTGAGAIANKFDIYDVISNSWTIGVLPFNIRRASIISISNTIYVAGGYVDGILTNQVWKLDL